MPPAAAAIGGAVAGIGSGIAGGLASSSAAGKAANTARGGQDAFRELEQYLPDIQAGRISLEDLRSAGILTPEMEESISQGNSELSSISLDPATRQAQMDALHSFQNIGNENGLDAQARANLAQEQSQIGQQERGSREAILQNAAQRGIGGSGLELAAQLQAQQSSADRMALAGTQDAANANQRKLEALQMSAGLGGQIHAQDYGEKSAAAQAQDAINRFNTTNRQDVQQRNVASANTAQAGNLANAQNIANQNVALHNSQQQYNKELDQRDFENRYKIAQGVGQQAQGAAQAQLQGGQAVANTLGGLGQAALGAGATLYANQPKKKYDAQGNEI